MLFYPSDTVEFPKLGWRGNGLQKDWSFKIILPGARMAIISCFLSLEQMNEWLKAFKDAQEALILAYKNNPALTLTEDDFEIVGGN